MRSPFPPRGIFPKRLAMIALATVVQEMKHVCGVVRAHGVRGGRARENVDATGGVADGEALTG